MKKFILNLVLLLMLLPGLALAQTEILVGGSLVYLDSNCDQAKYFPTSILCKDTDDGKLYGGNGSAVAEIGAGAGAGDIKADGSVPFTGVVTTVGVAVKNGTTSSGFVDFYEDGSNGTSYYRLYGPDALSGNIFSLLPPTAGSQGGMWYYSSANNLAVLDKGTEYQMLHMTGTIPAWTSTLGATGTRLTAGYFTNIYGTGMTTGIASTTAGTLNFLNATNANAFTITSGVSGAAIGWTLPTAAPGGANYLLNVDADGTMGYTDPAGFQTADADLTTFAGITPSADIQALLAAADDAAARTELGTVGISGAVTDEQLACWETTGGTNLIKSCGAKTVDNTTATHVVAKDNSNEAENLTLPGGFAITGTTSPTLTMTDRFVASFDGGGSEIADNKKVHIYIPWDCTITGWTILADQSGSIDFGVWSDTVGNHPATSDDSITDSHDPALSSADSGQDTDVADWSGEALTGGNVLTINVDSCTTITWASITFTVTR